MHMTFRLAVSKLRYHKSRTLLTGIAIMLTTALLMAIGTSGGAILSMNREIARSESNYHAAFYIREPEQLSVLQNHLQVESMDTIETFAEIVYGKMNGSLNYHETCREGVYFASWTLDEGHFPEKEDEICSVPSFFERVGAEPVVGGKVTLSFRVNGRGDIQTKEFTISGLMPDRRVSSDISDSRIAWGAYVAKPLLAQYEAAGAYEPTYSAYLRFYGEHDLTYNEIKNEIDGVASDIGLKSDYISYNRQYLMTMTEPDTEMMGIVAGISLIVILFSALVIYSIYYVGVITDIQEIGKLKALGASRRQIARLFFYQGGVISAFAIPIGLLIGFLLPYLFFPLVMRAFYESSLVSSAGGYADKWIKDLIGNIHMFSLPLVLVVALAVLITVFLSLRKPIRMAGGVSPVEAIRYQENSAGRKLRKGRREVKVSTLIYSNLARNQKRTTVTILTMGLSCVLFICVSAVLSSVSAQDLARRNIERGDFRISLNYQTHDVEYPENNLNSLVQQEYFSEAFLAQLAAIDGVEEVERLHGRILSSSSVESALYEADDNCLSLSYFTKEELSELTANLVQGSIDYDRMSADNEVLFTHAYAFQEYGLSIGDVFPLTLYDGDREIPLTVTLAALSSPDSDYPFLIMTEDTWNSLGLVYDPTTDLYLHVEESQYDSVKAALQDIVGHNAHFALYSLDEEIRIGQSSISLFRYPVYLILLLIAVISFMNLINTMITSIVSRKKELGILQAVGLSNRQLIRMLSGEGMIFTAGTLLISVTLGNLLGYMLFLFAKKMDFLSVSRYHYPLWETLGLALILLAGQTVITLFISKKVEHESLIDRIRSQE